MDVPAAAEWLADSPQSGRMVPETQDSSLREILLGSYRIIYRVRAELVEVLTVCHGAKLIDPSRLQ